MKISRDQIKLVDGFKIRNTLDIDFSVFHPHSTEISRYVPKFYIPEEEIWLDKEYKDELDAFVVWEELSEAYMAGGMSYLESREECKKKLCKSGLVPNFELNREKKIGYDLVLIDGKVIREYIDPEFVSGGHEYVYNYVPKNEIWIDNKITPDERKYVKLHEVTEWRVMAEGKNYDIGHELANAAEKNQKRLDGIGAYPGDANYPWYQLDDSEIVKKYYV